MRRAGGGSIVNIGSGMGHQATPGNTSYSASKAGVWMLTRCLALELREHDIRVNELVPGPVETGLVADLWGGEDAPDAFKGEWFKQPEDVVPLALFLASQPATGPTGQSFSLTRRPL
jgi:3-oxoacyl-[acyl-carrier protein] reductase